MRKGAPHEKLRIWTLHASNSPFFSDVARRNIGREKTKDFSQLRICSRKQAKTSKKRHIKGT